MITTHWTWQGTDDFLGSANRTRGRKEKPMGLIISFTDLDPDGCLVADLRKDPHQIIEKQDADTQKGLLAYWILTLQKRRGFFAMDRCFLLTGAF